MESQSIVNVFLLSPEWMLLLSILGYFLVRKPLSTIVGAFEWKQTLGQGIIVFCQLFLVAILIDSSAHYFGINDTQNVETFAQTISMQGMVGAGKIVFSAAVEELFFRGIIFTLLGSIPSILLFGIAHAGYYSWVEIAGALSAGIILVHARQQNKSIFPAIFGHALYNLLIIFLMLKS